MNDRYVAPHNAVSRAGAGIVGGLAGGVLLGLVLWLLGDLDDVGRLAGAHTIAASWVLHLVLCAVAGALYGVLVAGTVPAIGVGLVFGTALWLAVRLVAVPVATGTALFALDRELFTLGGYALFGVVLGLVYGQAGPRRNWRRYRRPALDVVYAVPRRRRRRGGDDG